MNEKFPNDQNQLQPITQAQETALDQPRSIDDLITQRTGGAASTAIASFPTNTEEGRAMFLRHMQDDAQPGTKDEMLNTEFTLVGYTMRTVLCRKNPKDGEIYDKPVQLIRSILETSDGKLIPSSSDYVAQDLRMCDRTNSGISPANPCRVKLRKGGGADRLVYLGKAQAGPVAKVKAQKEKATA